MDRLCRTCMKESHSYSPIYEETLHGDTILCEIINDVCQLEVSIRDELPKYVCSDCSFKLSEFKKFKIRSHEVEASFQRLKGNFEGLGLDEPNEIPSIENFAAIKVKEEPEDTYEAEASGIGYDDFEEYIGIDSVDLNAVKAEKFYPTCPDPLEFLDSVEIKEEDNFCGKGVPTEVPTMLVEASGTIEEQMRNRVPIAEKPIQEMGSYMNPWMSSENIDPCEGQHFIDAGNSNPKGKKEIRFFCTYCNKGFAKKSHLGDHIRVHTGVRPYRCSICDKSFAQKGDLNRHTLSHNNQEPCVCKECGKRFNQKRYLAVHMKIHTEGKKLACETCGKTFTTKTHLNRHARVHSEDNPFICNICGRRFKHEDPLKYHLRTHSDTMPFSCEICKKGFVLQSVLRKHLLCHSDVRPFHCEVCKKSFKNRGDLNKHSKLHDNTTAVK